MWCYLRRYEACLIINFEMACVYQFDKSHWSLARVHTHTHMHAHMYASEDACTCRRRMWCYLRRYEVCLTISFEMAYVYQFEKVSGRKPYTHTHACMYARDDACTGRRRMKGKKKQGKNIFQHIDNTTEVQLHKQVRFSLASLSFSLSSVIT